MTPARTLTEALRRCFTLVRDEADGTLPSLPLVRGRYAALARAWAACPDAPAVYAAAKAAWRAETGRCPVGGERGPCDCESARRAESEAVA
jgi:hypothetical protein